LVPLRICIIYNVSDLLFLSRLAGLIVVLVFVGGLLVLLVSVTALSYQEQEVNINIKAVFLPILLFISLNLSIFNEFNDNSFTRVLI
jgi:hypothetical protein